MIPYKTPKFKDNAFNCPHCHSYSDQTWGDLVTPAYNGNRIVEGYATSRCRSCDKISIWSGTVMIYPELKEAPLMPDDLPDNVKREYSEAGEVLQKSPRATCALLRLCIEKMVDELIPGSSSLNSKIGKLVSENKIDEDVQRALDTVRVIGDNAVHPLYMDLTDDKTTALKLFRLIEIIVKSTFTRKNLVDNMFNDLPENAKNQVHSRDSH